MCLKSFVWRYKMNTDTVRMNITIPKELARALNKYAGPRKRSL